MRFLLSTVLVLLTASVADLAAQQAGAPRPGDRVRIQGGASPGEFMFLGRTADTLLLRDTLGVDTIRAPLASVDGLWVGRPRTSGQGAARGAGIGFLIGGGTGALIGLASGSDPAGTWFGMTAGEKALLVGGILGLVGAAFGAAAGGFSAGQRWQRVPTAARMMVAPRPDGGVSLSLSIPVSRRAPPPACCRVR